MPIVELEYTCTVIVVVNTDTCEVERVNVDDEGAQLAPDQVSGDELAAVAIANEAMWPEWRFGF